MILETKSYEPKLGYDMLRGVDDDLAETSIETVVQIAEESLDLRKIALNDAKLSSVHQKEDEIVSASALP